MKNISSIVESGSIMTDKQENFTYKIALVQYFDICYDELCKTIYFINKVNEYKPIIYPPRYLFNSLSVKYLKRKIIEHYDFDMKLRKDYNNYFTNNEEHPLTPKMESNYFI